MIDRLLDLSQNRLLLPVLLVMGLAWIVKILFGLHKWRGQNRKEFLESWPTGDKHDDIWLEVVIRHLTGTYLPASLIRRVESVPGKVEALFEIAQVWPFLQINPVNGVLAWRKPGHDTHAKRRQRWRAWNAGYFVAAYIAAWLGMTLTRLSPTEWLTWLVAMVTLAAGTLALRCLVLADTLKNVDKIAPRWLAYFSAARVENLPAHRASDTSCGFHFAGSAET